MLLIQVLNLSDAAPAGLIAILIAVALGILAPALCSSLRNQTILLVIFVAAAAALEVLLRMIGITSLLQIIACVLTPFTLGLLLGTLIQFIRQLVRG